MNRKASSAKAPRRPVRAKTKPPCTNVVEQTLTELDQLSSKSAKARNVISLFQEWLRDESGYDEQTWPKLKKALDQQRARVAARRLFDA